MYSDFIWGQGGNGIRFRVTGLGVKVFGGMLWYNRIRNVGGSSGSYLILCVQEPEKSYTYAKPILELLLAKTQVPNYWILGP